MGNSKENQTAEAHLIENAVTSLELGVSKSGYFSEAYPAINEMLYGSGKEQDSRYGDTKEILNFKTEVTEPQFRCVGGYNRDINIFFLLAEAIWIWAGKKDVKTLIHFNSRMGEFSDNGVTFHAPYGFRIRHQGVESDKPIEGISENGDDQMIKALRMLSENPENRRVVIQIWNNALDLETKTKDAPCNDLLMFKIREGGLYQTIQNRSNDLHWGLPTNIFQFSFLGEIMSRILGVEYVNQVHNSQSLHYYTNNPIAETMHKSYQGDMDELYEVVGVRNMDFNFDGMNNVSEKLFCVDNMFEAMLHYLKDGQPISSNSMGKIKHYSEYMHFVAGLLNIYLVYKSSNPNDRSRMNAIKSIIDLGNFCPDYQALALNFFIKRVKDKTLLRGLNVPKSFGTF